MTGQTTFDELLEGRRLRDEGVERVELAEGEDWKDAARGWLARRAAQPGEFNADDLRAAVGSPERPNAMGAVFLWAVRQGAGADGGHAPAQSGERSRATHCGLRGRARLKKMPCRPRPVMRETMRFSRAYPHWRVSVTRVIDARQHDASRHRRAEQG